MAIRWEDLTPRCRCLMEDIVPPWEERVRVGRSGDENIKIKGYRYINCFFDAFSPRHRSSMTVALWIGGMEESLQFYIS